MKRSFVVLAVLLYALAAMAQVDRATLSGSVRDGSGSVIPAARVELTNTATGVTTRTSSNAAGTFAAVSLTPGNWVVRASAPGFEDYAQTVLLETGQRARLDITLSVGSLGASIEVGAATPLIDSSSAVLGTVVDQNEISRLPLAIRNWDDLLAQVPGIQTDRYTEQSGGTSSGRTGGVSVHGNRTLHNNYLLDGVANNSYSTNVQELSTQISRPSIDAIHEFKVVTSPFAAEYGWAPGGAIIVTTKSGTNQFQGTIYDYFRDDSFDAKNYFAKRANQEKAANEQNQLGFNVGGPILRNRAFFFLDYENTDISQGVLRTGRVATPLERNGVFSSTIRDPLTGQPFPGNTIPTDRIDPVAAKILGLLPDPNVSGSNNFIRQPNVQDGADRILVRLDVSPTQKDNVFARYIKTDRFRFVPGWFGGVLDGTSTSSWGRNDLESEAAVGGWTRLVNDSLFNELRISWATATSDGAQDPFGEDGMALIGFQGVPADSRILGGIVGIDIPGHIRMGSPNFMPKFQHTEHLQYLDTVTLLRGDHQWKFGADVMLPMKNDYLDIPSTRGNLQFSGQFTGNALADFLLGYPARAELSNVHVVEQRLWAASVFVQDDWTLNDRLTLNLGLRYDYMTPPYEANDRMANFDPATGTLVFATDGSLEDRALVQPDRDNFAPRLGLVYRLDERTVLRGGYGIYYNLFDRIGSEDQLALNPPGLTNVVVQTASPTDPVFLLRDGFPADYLSAGNLDLSRLLIRAADPDGERAEVQQFGAGIERLFGRDFVASVDLVGSFSENLAVLRNLNQPLPGTRDANGPVPYPGFGHIQWREQTGEARYYGADLSLEKRWSQGHSYRLSYTYGDSRDQAPEHLAASSGRPQNGRDLDAWEGPSDFDIRNRFTGNFIVQLPFGEGKPWFREGVAGAILGDWSVAGVFVYRSGRPFTVTQGTNNVGPGATGQPNVIGDTGGPETVDQWFDTSAFEKVPSGTFGNAGRNTLRGPDWQTFDLSLQKTIPVGQVATSLRLDVFNVFDRANFGLPDSNIDSRNFGVISSLAGDPRTMQLSLRIAY